MANIYKSMKKKKKKKKERENAVLKEITAVLNIYYFMDKPEYLGGRKGEFSTLQKNFQKGVLLNKPPLEGGGANLEALRVSGEYSIEILHPFVGLEGGGGKSENLSIIHSVSPPPPPPPYPLIHFKYPFLAENTPHFIILYRHPSRNTVQAGVCAFVFGDERLNSEIVI